MRLLAPLALHAVFLAAVAGGVASSLPEQAQVPLADRAPWGIVAVRDRPFPWGAHPPEANNLSGIAWLGGDRYALVSDKGGNLLWGEIKVDAATGAVLSARTLPEFVHVAGAMDMEGCAVAPDGRSLVVSDEEDTSLARVPLDFGAGGERPPLQRRANLFADARENLSLESLATAADGTGYWTINEDALVRDGARAHLPLGPRNAGAGAWLRLLKVDGHLRPVRQWAYRSDPAPGGLPVPMLISGVSDLLALPDGRLLVLERGFGATGFRIRLYLVDPAGDAPDVSAIAHLDRAPETKPLPKELLYAWTGRANFEGMTLGPVLADGSRSLLLVADDGGPVAQSGLLALKLRRMDGVVKR